MDAAFTAALDVIAIPDEIRDSLLRSGLVNLNQLSTFHDELKSPFKNGLELIKYIKPSLEANHPVFAGDPYNQECFS